MKNGKLTYPDGSTYTGQLLNNLKHGQGTLITSTTNYKGQFQNDKFHGNGTLQTPSYTYTGSFQNSYFHGSGSLHFISPSTLPSNYDSFLLFPGNEISNLTSNFELGEIVGPCKIETTFFDFLGLTINNAYQQGRFQFLIDVKIRSDLIIFAQDFAEIKFQLANQNSIQFENQFWQLQGYINDDFQLTGQCDLHTLNYHFIGIFDANNFKSGRIVNRITPEANSGAFLTQNYSFPLFQLIEDLSEYFTLPALQITPPYDLDFDLKFTQEIAAFEGEFDENLPRKGKFILQNGVVFRGERNGKWTGSFKFENLTVKGVVNEGKLEGECIVKYVDQLFEMTVEGRYVKGVKEGVFRIIGQGLAFTAFYSSNQFQGLQTLQIDEIQVLIHAFQGEISQVNVNFPTLKYQKEYKNNIETITFDSQTFTIERNNTQIIIFRNQETKFSRNYLKTPSFKYIGDIFDLKIQGMGVYEDDQKTVTGFFNGTTYNGDCTIQFKFPTDHFIENLNCVEIRGNFTSNSVFPSGEVVIKYENSIFTGILQEKGMKRTGIWQFSAVRFSGLWDGNNFQRGEICSGEDVWRGNFIPGTALEFLGVPFKLDFLGEVEKRSGKSNFKGNSNLALIEQNGEIYQGNLRDGLYHGQGVLTTPEFTFTGEFQSGKPMEGSLEISGFIFIGQFHGSVEITGKFNVKEIENDQFSFVGVLKEGIKNGIGELKTEEFEYVGGFVDDEFDGQGELIYKDGTRYSGSFSRGFKHGNGVFEAEMISYSGEFNYDSFHGEGVMKVAGVEKSGIFADGKLVQGEIVQEGQVRSGKFDLNENLVEGRFVGPAGQCVVYNIIKVGLIDPLTHVELTGDFQAGNFALVTKMKKLKFQTSNQLISVEIQDEQAKINISSQLTSLNNEYEIDQNFKSKMEFLTQKQTFLGFITPDLKIGQYGHLTTLDYHFQGSFKNELPHRGKFSNNIYQFDGTLTTNQLPSTGTIILPNNYKITAFFDKSQNPVGFCTISYPNGNEFRGFYKNGYEFGCGEINGQKVQFVIQNVPVLIDQQFLRENKEKLQFGSLEVGSGVVQGKIYEGVPVGRGKFVEGKNWFEGEFVGGKLCGKGISCQEVKFDELQTIINQFCELAPQIDLQPLIMQGTGNFSENIQINNWIFKKDEITYTFDYQTKNFTYSSPTVKITLENSQLTLETQNFHFTGNSNLIGKYIINNKVFFTGKTSNGKFVDSGLLKTDNFTYKGNFQEGKFHGIGVFRCKEFQFSGQFQHNQKHGIGVQKQENGDVFTGEFVSGSPFMGKMVYQNGQIYEGEM